MVRNNRQSYPASPISVATSQNRASSIFPYSITRPPTNFSSQSWVPPAPQAQVSKVPPLPRQPETAHREEEEEVIEDDRETPLYARSDWGESEYPQTSRTTGDGHPLPTGRTNRISKGWTIATGKSGIDGLGSEDYRSTIYTFGDNRMIMESPPPLPTTAAAGMMTARTPKTPRRSARQRPGHTSRRHSLSTSSVGGGWKKNIIDDEESQWGRVEDEPKTAWTQSSWAGPKTEDLGMIREESESSSVYSERSHKGNQRVQGNNLATNPFDDGVDAGYGYQDRDGYSPYTAGTGRQRGSYSAGSVLQHRISPQGEAWDLDHNGQGQIFDSPVGQTPFSAKYHQGVLEPRRPSYAASRAGPAGQSQYRSTLPSVLSLGALTQGQNAPMTGVSHNRRASYGAVPPFTAMTTTSRTLRSPPRTAGPATGTRRTIGFDPAVLDTIRPSRVPAALLTPAAQQRLGRMSVAPARYSLPPSRAGRPRAGPSNWLNPSQEEQARQQGLESKIASNSFGRMILVYRPVLQVIGGLLAASILSVATTSDRSFGEFIILKTGAFAVQRGTGSVALGITGWCAADDSKTCSIYTEGDFANGDGSFELPSERLLLTSLSNLLTVLTVFTWLLTAFLLTTLILQSILFFGLSIPFSHLIDEVYPKVPGPSKAEYQAEVDLRVKCERPPFDSWEWVWWAWWGHKRGPLKAVFGCITGVMALCTLGLAVAFKQQVSNGADGGSASVEFGVGTFVPIIVLFLLSDALTSSVQYWLKTKSSLQLFTSPPDPTPSLLLLPSSEKPMKLVIPRNGQQSYFAPRTTLPPPMTAGGQTIFNDPNAPPLPGQTDEEEIPMDPETIRWLAAYPQDPELVPLIARMKSGEENPDFVLSEVGLLYLRPEEDENALLVPPKGTIRTEILEDIHLEVISNEGDEVGSSAHWGPETMAQKLQETFWWIDILRDCEDIVKNCRVCNASEIEAKERLQALEERPGLTPVPFTGVTGWTGLQTGKTGGKGIMTAAGESAMAAEMAFAMRKAEDQARRDALG